MRTALRAGILGLLLAPIGSTAGDRLEFVKEYVESKVLKRKKTVADRVDQFGSVVRGRLEPAFARAGVAYPPASMTIAVFKEERVLELYASQKGGKPRFIKRYPVLAASGSLGPKLREGDNQVPEGLYGVESLNPNSLYHLALRVNYPNADDRANAAAEGRRGLGGDIMIHGNAVSIGCVAVGNVAAEELFIVAAKAGTPNIRVILSPVDFRRARMPAAAGLPSWTPRLYTRISAELAKLPLQ